jgi:hypothetical protein
MIFGKPDPKAPDVKPSNERMRMPPATPLSMPATPPNSSALRHEPPVPAPTTSSAPSSSASTVAAPSSRPEASTAAIRQIDRPEIAETFADAINGVVFDGQTLRIEFAVTRLDEVKANTPISGRRYPACRMVLPPTAAIDLINRMQQIAAALAQAGKVKAAPRKADAAKAG